MYQVQQITDDSLQQQTLVLPDGTQIVLQLYYRPMQYGWWINSLTYGDFVLQCLRISVLPDMLYQWKNQLPFGMACITSLNREPTQQSDFSSGAFQLYILTEAEVTEYTQFLSTGGTLA